MKKEELTYTAAKEEIEKIVGLIDSEELDVDQLAKHVKRATYLVDYCKKKLTSTDEELQKVLEELSV